MQHYIQQLSLICVLGVSTIMCHVKPHDQLGADIQAVVVQLTDICNKNAVHHHVQVSVMY